MPSPARVAAEVSASLKDETAFRPLAAMLLLAFHVVLAVVMYRSPIVATLHAMAAIAWYGYSAAFSKRMDQVAVAMAYVAGSEVLWRSTNGYVPQEAARYSIIIFSLLALARRRQWQLPWPPLIYIAFLLPSVLLTLTVPTLEMGRDQTLLKILVFNTIGPISLAVSVFFFTRVRLNALQTLRICFAYLTPVIGLAFIVTYALRTNKVNFGRSQVSVIRDEFGPNQLSAALGLGALFLFLMLVLDEKATLKRRVIMAGGMMGLLAATAITFSRGGLYNFGGAVFVGMFFLLRDSASRLRLFVSIAAIFVVGNFVVMPAMNSYSNGRLMERLTNTSLTGRDTIAWADLEIWRRNPVYGVGPGRGIDTRIWLFRRNQAHTEFTRMLGEHGIGGLISLCALLYMAFSIFLSRRGPRTQAVTAALVVWSFLYMTNAAMRLLAPSFCFGLACAMLNCEFEVEPVRKSIRRVANGRLAARRHAPMPASVRSLKA